MKHLLIGTVFLALSAAPSLAQMPPPPIRMISVAGEAHTELNPDQAILNLSLVSRNANLAEAKQHNDQLTEKLVAIAREFKIPKEKISTSNLNISPEYNYNNTDGKPRFVGYVVNRSLRITMDDITIHERLLSAAVDAKVDQVNGVEFTLKNPEEEAMKLRVKAVANAKAKADALAQAAGAKVGQVIAISESGAQPPMPPMPMMAMARMDAAEKSSVAPSLPGLMRLSESVNVTFALE